MANTIKTLSDGDITRKALSILHNNLVFTKTINREYDDRFARSGAKNGGSLLIREPNQFTIRSGAVMDTQDVTERTQTLTIATQRGVDINFSSVELTLSLDDFAERILEPAMARLAAEVDKVTIANCYPDVWNVAWTTITSKPAHGDLLTARAKLAKGLAPTSDRALMCESLQANSLISAGLSFYNPASELSRQYSRGLLGDFAGFKMYETEMTPTHTRGTATNVTPTVDLSAGTTSIEDGVAVIAMTANLTATYYHPGDTFTVAGLYAVNPETKARYGHLQTWTVTATTTCSAALKEIPVKPTPYTSGAFQNCDIIASHATASNAVICATGAGNDTCGTAGSSYVNALAYHRDAFTFVTADLEMPHGVDFAAREVYDGISLRLVRQYDIVNDKFPCRIDVLFGSKAIRPEWACRIIG